MFRAVYQSPIAKAEEHKAEKLVQTLFHHYIKNSNELPDEYKRLMESGDSLERVVCDYVGSMTDHYAIAMYEEIYIPKSWPVSHSYK